MSDHPGTPCSFCGTPGRHYGEIVPGPGPKRRGGLYLCGDCGELPRAPRFHLQQVRYDEVQAPPAPVPNQLEPWRVEHTTPASLNLAGCGTLRYVAVTWRCEVLVRPTEAKEPNP